MIEQLFLGMHEKTRITAELEGHQIELKTHTIDPEVCFQAL